MGQSTAFGDAEINVYGKVDRIDGSVQFFRVDNPVVDDEGRVIGGQHVEITEDEYKAGAES